MIEPYSIGQFRVSIDYALKLTQAVRRANCRWVHPLITDDFFFVPQTGKRDIVFELFRFKGVIRSCTVISTLFKHGRMVCNIAELLGFEFAYPYVADRLPIAALGSLPIAGAGPPRVPCFFGDSVGYARDLYLAWFDGTWNQNYVFGTIDVRAS